MSLPFLFSLIHKQELNQHLRLLSRRTSLYLLLLWKPVPRDSTCGIWLSRYKKDDCGNGSLLGSKDSIQPRATLFGAGLNPFIGQERGQSKTVKEKALHVKSRTSFTYWKAGLFHGDFSFLISLEKGNGEAGPIHQITLTLQTGMNPRHRNWLKKGLLSHLIDSRLARSFRSLVSLRKRPIPLSGLA